MLLLQGAAHWSRGHFSSYLNLFCVPCVSLNSLLRTGRNAIENGNYFFFEGFCAARAVPLSVRDLLLLEALPSAPVLLFFFAFCPVCLLAISFFSFFGFAAGRSGAVNFWPSNAISVM